MDHWCDLIDLLEEANYAEVLVCLWLRYEPFARMVRYELTLIPESAIESLGDRLDSEDKLSSDQLYEALDEKAITVYRCPKCRRLHLEEEPNKFTTYIIE